MDFEKIMTEITSGLSGNAENDIAYLKEQMNKYKEHDMSREIIRACSRMVCDLLPDDKKSEIELFMHNDLEAWNAVLEETRFNRYKKDYKKACELIEILVKKADDMICSGMFADDSVSEYHCFDNPLETVLYLVKNDVKKRIRRPDIFPFATVYVEYGSLLIDLGRYEEAKDSLKKAHRWNPANAEIAFEYAESYKITGDMETFFKISLEAFKYAYTPHSLARCYRNIGFYFIEKELWSEAIGCFEISIHYDSQSDNAASELYYINSKTDGKVKKPDIEELKKFGEKYGFPIGADRDVLGIAYKLALNSLEDNDRESAKAYYAIIYSLTGDERFKELPDTQ